MSLITTNDVAEKLGVSRRRVLALIEAGRLPAQRIGRDFLIDEKDVGLVGDRKPGRPPKVKEETDSSLKKKPSKKK